MRIRNIILFIIALTAFSFGGHVFAQSRQQFSQKSTISGIAQPVTLSPDSTTLFMEDFFSDVSIIDSVVADKCFSLTLTKDKKQLKIINRNDIPALSVLNVWTGKTMYSVLLRRSEKINKQIVFNPKKKYKTVQIAGDFKEWNPVACPMKKINKTWTVDLLLNPGTYYYQIVCDGKWMLDPANPDSADNNIGGFNSVLIVKNNCNEPRPELYTIDATEHSLKIGAKNKVTRLFVFWQNFILPASMISNSQDMISISIPEEAGSMERSFIRVYACNESGYSNDLLIPLKSGKVIQDVSDINRYDKEAQVIYFLMVDRFLNQDKSNDQPVNDHEVALKANYLGGDIKGIQREIDNGYFANLGINTLWISPLNQNPDIAYREYPAPHNKFTGYHGYWPISSTKIDKHFGTDSDMSNLVNDAHKNNINVILDYVAHHIHTGHVLWNAHPDWFTSIDLPDGRKNIRLWEECRLSTWFDTFLPTFDFTKPDVVECMTDSALFWIKKYHLDGFRHDATKHIPENYWRRLTQKIKNQIVIPENKPFYQIGETYGNRDLIGSYVNSGELDAQFDFNLYFDLRAALLYNNVSFEKLNASLQESMNWYGFHNLMGNITGNHDMGRFISYADGSIDPKTDDKEIIWNGINEVKDTNAYKKLSMLTAFIMTVPGIPVVYYGDELGIPGAGDPDNRKMMKFDGLSVYEQKTKDVAAKLIGLRRTNMALIYGDLEVLHVSEYTYVYMRNYFGKTVVVLLNKGDKQEKISIDIPAGFTTQNLLSNFGTRFVQNGNHFEMTLAGNSFEILSN